MKQVTIRRVEEAWMEKARREAFDRKISMNQVLVEALRRGLGVDADPVRKSNLDHYAGDSDFGNGWDDFLEKDLNRIDEDLWN